MNTDQALCEACSTVERVETLALFLAARERSPRVEFTIIPYLAKFVNGKIAQIFPHGYPEICAIF